MKKGYVLGVSLLFVTLLISAQSLVDPYITRSETKWVDSVYNALTIDERITQLIHIRAFSNKDTSYVNDLVEQVRKYQVPGSTFLKCP